MIRTQMDIASESELGIHVLVSNKVVDAKIYNPNNQLFFGSIDDKYKLYLKWLYNTTIKPARFVTHPCNISSLNV